MNVTEAFSWDNVSATQASFTALGGKYLLGVHAAAWNTGSVGLEQLAHDGVTWVPVVGLTSDAANSITLAVDGTVLYDLPGGTYRMVVSAATGIYASLARVPY